MTRREEPKDMQFADFKAVHMNFWAGRKILVHHSLRLESGVAVEFLVRQLGVVIQSYGYIAR